MKKVGLGLVGLGYVGKTHLRNCLRLKSAKLVAVSDISKRALRFATGMGVRKTYLDYRQLLKNDEVDGVIIALPTHLHASCAKEAAEAGKSILLEKPLARNVSEGEQIVIAARKAGVKLMVGYPLRFVSTFMNLKREMLSGVLGEVQTAYASMISEGPFLHRAEGHAPVPVPSWWFDKNLVGGGSLIDQGCHLINLLSWYFGKVKSITCHLGHRFNLEVEDHAACIMNFGSGTVAFMNVGWYSMKNQVKVELIGSLDHTVAHYQSSNKIVSAIQLLAGITPRFDMPYLLELQVFSDLFRGYTMPYPTGEEALEDLEVIGQAYKSSRN